MVQSIIDIIIDNPWLIPVAAIIIFISLAIFVEKLADRKSKK